MSNLKTLVCLASATLALSTCVAANANSLGKYLSYSGSANITSNYLWRGLSQTDNSPAVQASMELNSTVGIYAGVWGSNVNFNDSAYNTATSEIDLYAGYKNSIHGFNYDVGFLRYVYTRTTRIDWNEPYLRLGYKWFSAALHYSPNYSMTGEHSFYYNFGAHYTLPQQMITDLTLGTSIGRSEFSGVLSNANYTDYRVYATKGLTKNLNLTVEWTNTNINPSTNLNDSHFAASLALSL